MVEKNKQFVLVNVHTELVSRELAVESQNTKVEID